MELQSVIQNLGFAEKEASVYIALLQLGQATAYHVAKQSGLKQPTAYVILDTLITKGAARKILSANKTQYVATDPVEIFVEARSRVTQAEAALPSLRALAQNKEKVVQTSYYEGLDGIKEMYKNLLNEVAGKSYDGFFARDTDTPKALAEYWRELNQEMIKRKIKLRGITTKDKTTQEYFDSAKVPKELFELRALFPDIYSSNISIEIYGDFTQITSHRYVQGILIKNPDIANVMRQIFEIAWKKTAKYEKS
jgi:sugar-specific transcriptional regulator TrmB